MFKKLILCFLVVALFLSLLMGSCATTSTSTTPLTTAISTTTTATTQSTQQSTSTSSTTAVTSTQLAPYTKQFVVAAPQEITVLDMAMSTNPLNQNTLYNMYDPLVSSTPDGKPMQGGLSTWTVSEDGKVLTFTIRKGVTFWNGDPLTAEDVLFTHNRALKNNPAYRSNEGAYIDNVEVLSPYVIQFTFKQPNVLFLAIDGSTQLMIDDEAYYNKVGEDEFLKNPMGSGPYKFVDWKAGQYIDLTANENYWGGAPQVKNVRIVYAANDSTRVAMLQTGEADMIVDTPWPDVGQLKQAGFNTTQIACSPTTSIRFDNLNPNTPWADKRVRQAFAYAIDRKSIVQDLFYGIPDLNAWLGPNDLGYDPNLKPYPYDPAKAKQLLADAGYPNGFDAPLYVSNGAIPGLDNLVSALVLYLQAINVNLKVQGYDATAMSSMMRKWHNDPTAEVIAIRPSGVANFGDPISTLVMGFSSSGGSSIFKNTQLDDLINQGRQQFNDDQRAETIRQIFNLCNDEMPIVPILSNVSVTAMKSNVSYSPVKFSNAMINLKGITVK